MSSPTTSGPSWPSCSTRSTWPSWPGRSPLRGHGADTYQYELTVDQGDRSEHVTVDDTQVPAELRPVIKRLEARAVEERRSKR